MSATPVPATNTPVIHTPRDHGALIGVVVSSMRLPFLSLLLQAMNSPRHSTMHSTVVTAPTMYTI